MFDRQAGWHPEDGLDVRIENAELVYRGFLKVGLYRLHVPRFDGAMSTLQRELLEWGSSVCILPYDPRTDRVLLIRQFLVGSHLAGRAPRPLQVVAGIVDAGETCEAAARREAFEEAGCTVERVVRAQTFLPSPGVSSERVTAFCGEADLTGARGIYGVPSEGEDIRVEVVDAQRAVELLDRGRIEPAFAVIMLSWFARHRDELHSRWS